MDSDQEAVDQELRKRFKVLSNSILSHSIVEPVRDKIYRYSYEAKKKDEEGNEIIENYDFIGVLPIGA